MDYFHTRGTSIVNPQGQEHYFTGINLGNWLVWEGYLMMGDFKFRTHSQLLRSFAHSFNSMEKAKDFEHQWRLNYVDEKAVKDLAELGFNSLRIPFSYSLFYNDGVMIDQGFYYIDRLIDFCRPHNLSLLLDMHGAPGYQNPGDHSDNENSNENQPRDSVGFWDRENIEITCRIWKHIAQHYKDEPLIWGYDLLNEPVAQEGREYEILPSYIKIKNAIRQVDPHHIIVVEGSWWGSDFRKLDWTDPETIYKTGVNQAWDHNLVYENHHYGPCEDTQGREMLTNKLNIPFFTGEYGENDVSQLRRITQWSRENTSGHFSWSFKKMTHNRTLWTISPDSRYRRVVESINRGERVTVDIFEEMMDFVSENVRNGHPDLIWHQDFYEAVY